MKASGSVDPSPSRVSSLPVRELIHHSTQDISEQTASSRMPSAGVHHTLTGIHASSETTNVQAPMLGKLTRLKSLEKALTEEIQEERLAAEGGAEDLMAVPASSLFSRLKERLASVKDVLHQKLSPTYRAQVTAAVEFVQQAQTGPSIGREFSLPVLNLNHSDPDQQIQRLRIKDGSLRPESPVLYLDRIQLLDAGYTVMGIQAIREVAKQDSASGPCLCVKGDSKRVIFTNEGQRVTTSPARDRLLLEFQHALQEKPVVVPAPQREMTAQQATTISRPLVEKVGLAGLNQLSDFYSGTSELPPEFFEDIERLTQSAGPLVFHHLEGKLRLGGLTRALDQVYDAFQRQGVDDNLRQVPLAPLAKNAYHKALASILQTQAGAVEMAIQKNNSRTPFLETNQLTDAVDRPVVFQRAGKATPKSEELISTRRFALKLKPESYGDAAQLATRLLRDFPEMVDAIKLFPPRQAYARQDSLVVYLKNEAPSARSEQFKQIVEALSDADVARMVTEDERIPGMQRLGATGIYYVDNPPLVSAEGSITGAMPPFNTMGSEAPGGSHGRFMALIAIASSMLATRENIPLKEAVQKVWRSAWDVSTRDVTTPQSRQ